MSRLCCVLGLILALAGCNDSDHPGFKRFKHSVHYQLHQLGDDAQSVRDAQHVSFRVSEWRNGAVAQFKDYQRVNLEQADLPEVFRALLQQLSQGDSITILGSYTDLEYQKLFRLTDPLQDSLIQLEVVIKEALTDKQLRQLLAMERVKNDLELKEQAEIKRLVDSLEAAGLRPHGGIYVLVKDAGGDKPVPGDWIRVQYHAYTMLGDTIDNTFLGGPLEYELGKPDQVLPGFATGLTQIGFDGKALFIIPSQQAFGERGSSSGIIPPYTTMIYDVHLLSNPKNSI